MLKINEGKGVLIEVLDLETQETISYSSVRKAAEAIGCNHGTILLAKKVFLEKGISRPVKKRYLINFEG